MELNQEYIARMEQILGNDYKKYIAAMEDKTCRAFHVNTTIPRWSELKDKTDIFGEQILYTSNGYYYAGDNGIGNTPAHHAGIIYMQEPSAMLPISAYDFSEAKYVLDLCAAPGGKSSQIANALKNGVLFANEIVPERAAVLARNIERMGYKNTVVTRNSPEEYAKLMPEFFDVVLVDAPCSGEGMMRKEPEAVTQWSQQLVESCAARQKSILDQAHMTLKSGGTLIYSTCTFSVEENEEIISYMLRRYGYELKELPSEIKNATVGGISQYCHEFDSEKLRRFYPFLGKGEGQTFAVLEKPYRKAIEKRPLKRFSSKRDKSLIEFIENYTFLNASEIYFDGKNYCKPTFGFITGLNTIFDGVRLGTVEDRRFIPHHHFFSALSTNFVYKTELDEKSAKLYLHGDELSGDIRGWGVFTYLGAGLGGYKASEGRAKNHYPKGLRNLY